jgi:hypothetical protein
MTITTRTLSLLLLGSLNIAAASSASAANQDDIFWRQLQRTDGVAADQTQPRPQREASAVAQTPAPDEWIVAQLKKSDGYSAQPQLSQPARVRDRPVVRDKT